MTYEKLSEEVKKLLDNTEEKMIDLIDEYNLSIENKQYEYENEIDTVDQPLFDIAMKLEEIALEDDYFIERKLYPNVDFYSGIILKALGIPMSMYTVMFALARSVGWVAQWLEMMEDPDFKIGRPRQLYTGEKTRSYIPIEKRG